MITGKTCRYRVRGWLSLTQYIEGQTDDGDPFWDDVTKRIRLDKTVLADSEWEAEDTVVSQAMGVTFETAEWADKSPTITCEELPEDERLRLMGATPLLEV